MFLVKSIPDGMGGIIRNETIDDREREFIRQKQINHWLNPDFTLCCLQGLWSDVYKERPEDRIVKLLKERPECSEKKYFLEFALTDTKVEKILVDHRIEQTPKVSVPAFKTEGWGWKLVTLFLSILNVLQAFFIGLLALNEELRDWFFSIFN